MHAKRHFPCSICWISSCEASVSAARRKAALFMVGREEMQMPARRVDAREVRWEHLAFLFLPYNGIIAYRNARHDIRVDEKRGRIGLSLKQVSQE